MWKLEFQLVDYRNSNVITRNEFVHSSLRSMDSFTSHS